MDVLVTESMRGAARVAVEQLEAAGHRVHRCHEDGSATFPCAGLTSECPLDATPIDLVLAIREAVRPSPAPGEDGVTCGLRHRIPVAVTGQTLMNPFESFGAEPVAGDLVAAVERIAAAGRPAHEQRADVVLRQTLEAAGCGSAPSAVSVRREGGRLRVRIAVSDTVPQRTREVVAVRVVGRLREFDPHAAGIDVDVETLVVEE